MNENYKTNIRIDVDIDKQKLSKETEAILALIYRSYWATDEEKNEFKEKKIKEKIEQQRKYQENLKETFEKLLLEKIDSLLPKLSDQEQDYKEFLLASKNDINATHAGYFSHDNSNSDEAIAQEVKEILFEKKKLLKSLLIF